MARARPARLGLGAEATSIAPSAFRAATARTSARESTGHREGPSRGAVAGGAARGRRRFRSWSTRSAMIGQEPRGELDVGGGGALIGAVDERSGLELPDLALGIEAVHGRGVERLAEPWLSESRTSRSARARVGVGTASDASSPRPAACRPAPVADDVVGELDVDVPIPTVRGAPRPRARPRPPRRRAECGSRRAPRRATGSRCPSRMRAGSGPSSRAASFGYVGGDRRGQRAQLLDRALERGEIGAGEARDEHRLEEGDALGARPKRRLVGETGERGGELTAVAANGGDRRMAGEAVGAQRIGRCLARRRRACRSAAARSRTTCPRPRRRRGRRKASGCSGQSQSADRRSTFLVRRHHQLQRAASRPPARARERDRRGDLRGHLALHVLGAATANLAIDEVARRRVEAPLDGIGRDGVHASEQAEGLAVASPGYRRSGSAGLVVPTGASSLCRAARRSASGAPAPRRQAGSTVSKRISWPAVPPLEFRSPLTRLRWPLRCGGGYDERRGVMVLGSCKRRCGRGIAWIVDGVLVLP